MTSVDRLGSLQEVIDLVGDMNTIVVGNYFEDQGFKTKRLDTGRESDSSSNCDWLVQGTEVCFLCEVKTINSVRRGEDTQAVFRRRVENRIRHYFSRKRSVRHLPYHLHFHSSTLSIPEERVLNRCLRSVTRLLLNIHAQAGKQALSREFYDCCEGAFDLVVTKSCSGKLEVKVSVYGHLNLRAVEDRLGDAITQLRRSGEDFPGMARVIVLAFVSDIYITQASEVIPFSGLHFEEGKLWRLIDSVLRRNDDLSAIALMYEQTPPRFGVYHNPISLRGVERLDRAVFDDGVSVQFDSLSAMPRVAVRPFNLHEFTASILEAARGGEQRAITLADYAKLKRQKTRRR